MIKVAVYLFVAVIAAAHPVPVNGVQGDKKPSDSPHFHVGLDGDLYIRTENGEVGQRLISEVVSRYTLPDDTIVFASRNSLVAVNGDVSVDFYGKFTATIPEKVNVALEPVSERRLRLRLSTGGKEARVITFFLGENEVTAELKPLIDVTFEVVRTTDAGKVIIEIDRKRFDVTNTEVVLTSKEYVPPASEVVEPDRTPSSPDATTGASIVRTAATKSAEAFSLFKVASPTQPQ